MILSSLKRFCSSISISARKNRTQLRPAALALYKRQIGAFQKPFRIGSVGRRQCDADAHRSDDRLTIERHRRGHRGGETACKISRLIPVADSGLNDDKLVAAEPGHEIVRASDRAQALGDRPEQEVAAVVTKRVIDAFEAVEIEEMHGDTAAARRQDGKAPANFSTSWVRFARPVRAS